MPDLIDLPGAGWRQHARLLRLSTPAGPDVLLAETARIDEALGPVAAHAGFRIELTALAADARLSLSALLGQPARLDLQTAASRTLPRPFHGHITAITRLGANGGFARYRLVIEPWLAFLGHNGDSYLFQDKTVVEIIDAVFGGWKQQGALVPDWRWDLRDSAALPRRGMTVQYRESDLAFVRRLLVEAGLVCWFEHLPAAGDGLGRHRLVIADHPDAFVPNSQPVVRFTQAGATLAEDSLQRWHAHRQQASTESRAASWDYRSLSNRPQSAPARLDNGKTAATEVLDPGPYAWPSAAHGQARLDIHRQASDARLEHFDGAGTVRSMAPGTTFVLADHPAHVLDAPDARRFLVTAVTHHARNNLTELIPTLADWFESDTSGSEDMPDLYRNELVAQRADLPWRPLALDAAGRPLALRPHADGPLTAIVVGTGAPTHTDRDLRIRVQFPWQRGSRAASREPHPHGTDNAPGDASLGVWLRVLAPVAGANWGAHFTPRPGQEVVVAFLHGNPDRPVVVGAVYNGQGRPDASGNMIGSATATPAAPAFFAGDTPPHAHGASLSGIRTRALEASRDDSGGHNQLVFDDSPGQARIELASTQRDSHLQLGHLKHQDGNARLQDRGHGAELTTAASAALRAGNGLLVSADARPGAGSAHLDSREPIARTRHALDLAQGLADVAARQHAGLPDDPASDRLPALRGLQQAIDTLGASASLGAAAPGSQVFRTTGGGTGRVPAWSAPCLHFAAPAGIAQLTARHHILVAGASLSFVARDVSLGAQASQSLTARDGIALFTTGKPGPAGASSNAAPPGIRLHAAHGEVSLQAQGGTLTAAADKAATLASTGASLTASAKTHLLATAGGACLRIEGGNIQLHAPGKVAFRASKKILTGAKAVAERQPGSVDI